MAQRETQDGEQEGARRLELHTDQGGVVVQAGLTSHILKWYRRARRVGVRSQHGGTRRTEGSLRPVLFLIGSFGSLVEVISEPSAAVCRDRCVRPGQEQRYKCVCECGREQVRDRGRRVRDTERDLLFTYLLTHCAPRERVRAYVSRKRKVVRCSVIFE